MKNLVVILSHCNSEPKLGALRNLISRLKEDDLDVMVMTHISLPKDIQDSVEYMVYDKSNPILKWPEYGVACWITASLLESITLHNIREEHGWTVFNQIRLAGNVGKGLDYTHFTFVNYDTKITEHMVETIKNPSDFISGETPLANGVVPSLLFQILSKENLEKFISFFSRKNYITHDLHAEGYFQGLRENFNYQVYPYDIESYNFVWTSNRDQNGKIHMFDFGVLSDNFKIFVGKNKNNLVVYEVNQETKFKINGINVLISKTEVLNISNEIKSIGFYKEGEYIDLFPLYKDFIEAFPNTWIKVKDKDI